MSSSALPPVTLDGRTSLPRRNGEIAFDAVWQARLFGLTMALFEAGAFAWDEFRDRLIAAIGAWDRTHDRECPEWDYWSHWLAAFEDLVVAKRLVVDRDLADRLAQLAARPPGHDHG